MIYAYYNNIMNIIISIITPFKISIISIRYSIAPCLSGRASRQSIVGTVNPATCSARKCAHHPPQRPRYRLPLLTFASTEYRYHNTTTTTIIYLYHLYTTAATSHNNHHSPTLRFFRSLHFVYNKFITAFTSDPVSCTDRTTLPLTSNVRCFCISP